MSPESSLSDQLAAAQDHIRHLSEQLAAEREAAQQAHAQWQRQLDQQQQHIAQLTAQVKASETTTHGQTDQAHLLWEITQQIRQALDVDVVLETGVDQVRQFFGVDRAVVYRFLSDWSGDFVAESVTGPWVKILSPEMHPVWADTCLQENQGSRFQNQELLAVPDIYQAGFQPCHVEVLERLQAKAFVVAPIFAGDRLWGLLAIYQNTAPRSWQEEDLTVLQQVAGQLGIALHQASLYEQIQAELHQRQQTEAVLRGQLGAIEAAVDGIALLQGGRFIYLNPAHGRLFGYEATTELIGQSWHKLHSPEVIAQMDQEMQPTLRREKCWQGEVLAKRRDGSSFLEFLSLTLLDDDVVVAICRDITQEKQSTQAFQDQQRFINQAIQTNPDLLVFLFDVPSQSLLFVSESVAQLLAYTADDILAMGANIVLRMMHPDDQPRFAAYLDQLDHSQPGETLPFECRVHHRDGRWLDVLLRGSVHTRDDQGHLQQFLGSVTNITSRRLAEANLQASEVRFEAIANLVPDFLWESAPDCSNTWCNQRWLDYTGQTLEQALGHGWLEAVHPEDRAGSVLVQQEAVKTGEFRHGERRVRRHDGEYRWFVSNIFPVKNAAGEVIKLYGAVTDVHETRMALEASQLSAEINAFRVKLSDALRSLTPPFCMASEACRLLGEQLGADRVFYMAIDEAADIAHIEGEYRRDDAVALVGQYPLADYRWSLPYLRQGETIVLANTQTTPTLSQAEQARLKDTQLLGLLAIPLIHDETLVGTLVATKAVAHEWTAAEVILVSAAAERLWAAIERAAAEAAVKDLSERLALALKAGAIGTWDWDGVNEVLWDEPMYSLYGLSQQEDRAIYPTWRNSLHPDDRDRVEALLQAAVRGEAIYDTEFRILRPTGEQRWIHAMAQVQASSQGNLIRVVGINQDITERKAAEAALQEQTNRLTLALEAGAFGVAEWDFVNPPKWDKQVYKIYGLENLGRPVTYQDWYDHLHPDDASQVEATLTDASEVRSVITAEFRIVRPDGELRWVQAFAKTQHDAEGNPLRIVTINQDITERKQTEADLKSQTDRLSLALEAGAFGTWEWDFVHAPVWDDRMYEIHGLQHLGRPVTYQDWRDLAHPDDVTQLEIALEQSIKNGLPLSSAEIRICRPDGEHRWMEIFAQVQRDAGGIPVRMVGINKDITIRKQAEAERKANEITLRRTNAELERATRLKDEFLANMSHELRTPLNAILGMTEGLQEEVFGPLSERQQRSLDTIERSSSHLLSLINDILDLSKIEAGQLDLDFSPVNVGLLCRASITFIKQQAHKKHQQLNTLIPDYLPNLYGDDRRLRQVLINLLTNAVKFTPEGGQITLTASYSALSHDDAQTWVLAHPQANPSDTLGRLSIAITDTGIGISLDDAQRLFQPFMQVNTALNRQHEGTGLGLALVKRIVEAHGGEVTLTSETGQGSCFTVQFPIIAIPGDASLSLGAPAFVDATASADLASAPLILLAEDSEANINTTRAYLEAKGYQIIVAHNGLEAVHLAASALPDIILMDIQMPHLDGLEAIRQVRQNPALATVPIIALTALAMPKDEERCLAAGANYYLSKPIRLKQLAQVIETLAEGTGNPGRGRGRIDGA
ncbi:MAG: PAS domain-containing protein [Leptolyngbya sp.]|nr:PAS domain-containing protein [Leptolyngbya sp.]